MLALVGRAWVRNAVLSALAVLQLGAGSPPVSSDRVVDIVDGDSLWALTPDGERVEVRLADIDCPEGNQPYGDSARRELSELVSRKYVRIERLGLDDYGRTLGRVRVGSLDVNAEMVRRGAAWVYRKYLRDQSLLALEKEARAAKRGLWALPEAERVPPWKWRKSHRRQGAPPPSHFTCGAKTRCREMSSCAEARFYLEHCGATKIDGDGNGVPCEALCR